MALIFISWLLLAVVGSVSAEAPAGVQQPEAPGQAAESITATALAADGDLWRSDTMRSPDAETRIRALDARARSLAERFRELGLQPLVPAGSKTADTSAAAWIWHYPVPGQLRFDYVRSAVRIFQSLTSDTEKSRPVWAENGRGLSRSMSAGFASAARFASDVGTPIIGETVPITFQSALIAGSSRTMLVAGPQTPAGLQALDLYDKVVFYLPPTGIDSAIRRQVLAALYEASRGVILVTDQDSATFARQLHLASQASIPVVEGYMRSATADRWPWAAVLRADELSPLWRTVGTTPAKFAEASTPIAIELPLTEAWLYPAIDSVAHVVTAPDVVGILEGRDSLLKDEYITISASLDSSGPSALLALARAFSQPGARPRRSVVFLATSGTAPDFAGTWYFANPLLKRRYSKLRSRVAALTVGSLDALAGDSVVIDGSADFTFGVAPAWIGAMHPELGLHVVDGGTAFQPGTAAYAFVRSGIPSLAFHPMAGGPLPAGARTPRKIERMVSALRLVFYVAQEVGNTTGSIKWTEAGRTKYVDPLAVQP